MKLININFSSIEKNKNINKGGFILAYVVGCVALILVLLAMLLSMAIAKNNIVSRSIKLIERKTEVTAIGEAFIGKKGELSSAELSSAKYKIVVENISVTATAQKRLTVSQGNRALLIVEIEIINADCKILRYDATW